MNNVLGRLVKVQDETPAQTSDPNRKSSSILLRLRSLIQESSYRPGMRLPPERELARRWKVGRPAVREAIKALTILDVLESRQGDGTYVKSLDGLSINGRANAHDLEPDFNMLDLLEARKMIEPKAAGLAAVRASKKQLEDIKKQVLGQQAHLRNRALAAKYDYLFHDAITRASCNPILIEISRTLGPRLLKSRSITAETTPSMAKMLREHQAIFEAIVRREPDTAEHAMLEHLHTVGLDLISAREE